MLQYILGGVDEFIYPASCGMQFWKGLEGGGGAEGGSCTARHHCEEFAVRLQHSLSEFQFEAGGRRVLGCVGGDIKPQSERHL